MTPSSELLSLLEKQIASYKKAPGQEHVGVVTDVGDGIATIEGLAEIASAEMVDFGGGVIGSALNLGTDSVGAIIFGDTAKVKQGDTVRATGKILSVPVSEGLIGRVVSPMGEPKDGGPAIQAKAFYPVEKIAPGVLVRKSVDTPLQTGIAAIDSMIPIGRGQRELIIGDRQTGKTAVVVDTIINQKLTQKTDRPVICIYVAIGQKESKVRKLVKELEQHGAMEYTIVVSSGASESAALSYIAPFAGCAMAEYFLDQGKDVLCIYDDLSRHAWAYRQISLLLRRPPGREAYPGDVFYLHSRLLERACRLDDKFGGGSITALPIIETQASDVSAYIPTNVISITDGQIFLESDLFYKGIRPAVNVGISVSRVGSAAQRKSMKKVSGKLRLDLAQYRELAAFAQFGSDLDAATKKQIDRGVRLTELLKQDQFAPMSVGEQVASLYAGINGYFDDVPVNKVKEYQRHVLETLRTQHFDVLQTLDMELKPEAEEKLKRILSTVKDQKGYATKS